MKARRLKDLLGSKAFEVAKKAGYSRSYWDLVVSRDNSITDKFKSGVIEGLEEHIADCSKLLKELRG